MNVKTRSESQKIHIPKELETMPFILPDIMETVKKDYKHLGLKRSLSPINYTETLEMRYF